MATLDQKLEAGEVVVLDGAIGTELQRRGAPMDEVAWCARATQSHPHLLLQIHQDFIHAGAEVITANTYASSRTMLEPAGLGDSVAEINNQAVALALEARDLVNRDYPVAVAGSMSTMSPLVPGTDHYDPTVSLPPAQAKANYREIAELLAEAGVDLILMEMMMDIEQASLAVEAATATGLPVWVGFSCGLAEDGAVVMRYRDSAPFDEVIDAVMGVGGTVAGVMHSTVEVTTPALEVLMGKWQGPVAAYPESGSFKMPEWQFVDLITPRTFAAQCRTWVESGVQIVGGCCGIGPAHIKAMSMGLPRKAGARSQA